MNNLMIFYRDAVDRYRISAQDVAVAEFMINEQAYTVMHVVRHVMRKDPTADPNRIAKLVGDLGGPQ